MICLVAVLYLLCLASGQFSSYNPWYQWFIPQPATQKTTRPVRQWPLLEIPFNSKPAVPAGQGFGYYEADNFVPKEQFQVYWNVPTFQCHQYGLNFSEVRQWGIIENDQGHFRGNEIALLYDPGVFPALLKAGGGDHVTRNGGVPQKGDLSQHLQALESSVQDKLIPDRSFSGLGVIDFEHWRPVFEENFGSLNEYRKLSRQIERGKHPFWTYSQINQEATRQFEQAAKDFMYNSLLLMRKLRPNARWGYYGFPLCFNYTPRNQKGSCTSSVRDNNNRNRWLFSASSSIFPSLYLKHKNMTEWDRLRFMEGRLDETNRVKDGKPVYPYIWYKYFDDKEFMKDSDMINALVVPRKMSSAGVIIWGSSNDVNTERKCRNLLNYLHNTLGPAVKTVRRTPKLYLDDLIGRSLDSEVEYEVVQEWRVPGNT